jgi:mannose-6-phosphate isomerase
MAEGTRPALAARAARLKAWLLQAALPIWWEAGADRVGGGYHDRLDLSGEPVIPGLKRARVQTRQAWSYVQAGRFGWHGPWRAASAYGLRFVRERLLRPDGLYRAEAAEDRVDLYDQAFVLLALSAATRAGDPDATGEAIALAERLEAFAHPLGGYRPLEGGPLDANSNMHLLEAFLAWRAVANEPRWSALADRQAKLALERLVDPADDALTERFDDDWSSPADRVVDPGHQFEWAWLLLGWDPDAGREAALRLLDIGEARGLSPARAVILALSGDLTVIDPVARLWSQCERVRANLLAARLTGDERRWEAADEAVSVLETFLSDVRPGLWRDRLLPDGTFVEEPALASSLYHVVGAVLALEDALGPS